MYTLPLIDCHTSSLYGYCIILPLTDGDTKKGKDFFSPRNPLYVVHERLLNFLLFDAEVTACDGRGRMVKAFAEGLPACPVNRPLHPAERFAERVGTGVDFQPDAVAPPLNHLGNGIGGKGVIPPLTALENVIVVPRRRECLKIGLEA